MGSTNFRRPSRVLINAILIVFVKISLSFGKTDLLVFLLSGQSNMSGQGLVNELPAYLNRTVDNVMIYLQSEGDAKKRGKWLPLGPGFGRSEREFGPELTFGRTLTDSMPGTKFAFVKDAVGATTLNSSDEWRPPSSGGNVGKLYSSMMQHIQDALAQIDKSEYELHMAGFVWLQGETDAKSRSDTDAYETNLTNLIFDIRDTLNTKDLPVIIPMIDVQKRWVYSADVRAAEIAIRNKLENVDTLDTRGFETDGVHYRTEGLIKIGRIAAQRWLDMKYLYPVGTLYSLKNRISPTPLLKFRVLPQRLHCTITDPVRSPFRIDIRNIQGRVFLSKSIISACNSFYLPSPGSGLWIVEIDGLVNRVAVH